MAILNQLLFGVFSLIFLYIGYKLGRNEKIISKEDIKDFKAGIKELLPHKKTMIFSKLEITPSEQAKYQANQEKPL